MDAVARALWLKGPRVLAQSAVAVSHTGDTAEFTLASVTVDAGAMGANGRIVVEARFSATGTAGTKTIRVKLGSTTFATHALAATRTALRLSIEIANRSSASSQHGGKIAIDDSAAGAWAAATATENTANALALAITGQDAAAADAITLESYQVILYPTR